MLRMLYPWSLWVASVMLGSVAAFAWKRRPVVIKSSLGDVRLCISVHLEARTLCLYPVPRLTACIAVAARCAGLFVCGPRCFAVCVTAAASVAAVAVAPPPCSAPTCVYYISLGMVVHPTICLVLKHRVCSQPFRPM